MLKASFDQVLESCVAIFNYCFRNFCEPDAAPSANAVTIALMGSTTQLSLKPQQAIIGITGDRIAKGWINNELAPVSLDTTASPVPPPTPPCRSAQKPKRENSADLGCVDCPGFFSMASAGT
jgi:hypothetical protein